MSRLTQKDFEAFARYAADKLFNRVFLVINEPLNAEVRAFIGMTWPEIKATLVMVLSEEISYLKRASNNSRFDVDKMHNSLDSRVIHVHAEYSNHMYHIAANANDIDLLSEVAKARSDAFSAKKLTRDVIDKAIKAVY